MSGEDKFASLIGGHRPEATNIVIFGANGDLTKRKLLPALAHMHHWNLLGHNSRIIGVVRQKWTHADWVHYVHDELLNYFPEAVVNPPSWRVIAAKLDLVSGDLAEPVTYRHIAEALHEHEGRKNALFYLAIPPAWYDTVARHLHEAGLSDESEGFRRLVIEKPFGMDLPSAQKLNIDIQSYFDEAQIYRIDHYLGKEAVQNLMVFRFANSVLEPLWNRNYIDHVQISVAESLGVGYRAGYYETSGALRDMIQSHLMQVMSLVAMEAPVSLDADDVRDEKMKVLRSIRPFSADTVKTQAVRAQYAAGEVDGEKAQAYRSEPGVDAASSTETFAAVKFYIDNWRWQGVPFVLRTGKRLPVHVSEICIRFKEPPQKLFELNDGNVRNNELIFRLQPDAGMQLSMTAKQPGLSTHLRGVNLDATYGMDGLGMPEAYETLLHDVMMGEAGLFSRADEVEECWKIVAPILDAWAEESDIATYPAGTFDIPGMDTLLQGCEGGWRDLSESVQE
ncbi:MAG: glucose-6-phosphate dehydrogenase [Zetaproteobacteria bacterium CG12_big_fil_rev_8_21_14_0_65_55_1124]|nr:MAG: glucose-6-phosphate dehydrogenase [Zetaproteobacteria bacterium CG1_02_55_237]PIS19045.1 MAG: glucose-6-phosphate dehydrogenase [Zetaproteobacteria bacterium CG08_land_8_20_14_0_20_55_17]PIW41826.1 MAG: glucose-6-phosphate dehydrogenase [Zetaproteobacteria bacterium CG12_big_fil_rev_8_21_14_0_65_55_1124]PIY54062.1 MAG: glucose-6-phosphate dehydrogenase [Zetaproteobacteria bacterium CG_4_10_14_0_8_um_filter_55_43]PIZ40237.1 MAG: glucose-6-phosphate dehydrogenase [Zetaproteobacteria bacte